MPFLDKTPTDNRQPELFLSKNGSDASGVFIHWGKNPPNPLGRSLRSLRRCSDTPASIRNQSSVGCSFVSPVQVRGFSADFAVTWKMWVPQRAFCGLLPIQVIGFSGVYAVTWMRRVQYKALSGMLPV